MMNTSEDEVGERKSNTTPDFQNGFICKYNSSKGFGFIQSNGKAVSFIYRIVNSGI